MVNETMRDNWTHGAVGWVANEAIFDLTYQPVTDAIVTAADLVADCRVLDIGCGTGTLLAAAGGVGASAVGVDISPPMVEAAAARVPTAVVRVADAQAADLLDVAPGAPFDRVVSRFGVMFFDDPTAAFTNVRRACRDGAQLTFACWRGLAENPTFTLGTSTLVGQMAAPPPIPGPRAPGPMAFAEPAYVTDVLTAAGWSAVEVAPLDFECVYSRAGDGVEERMTSILALSSGRAAAAELEPRLGAAAWAALLDDIRAELREHVVDGRLRHPGACWLVNARA